MDPTVIRRLEDTGVDLFRINLSHTRLEDLEDVISRIQKATDVPLCLDTEGAQIRTSGFAADKKHFQEFEAIRIVADNLTLGHDEFGLTPNGIVKLLRVGDILTIDFNSVLVQVIGIDEDGADLRVINGGEIARNKAVTLYRDVPMPPLSDKDVKAIEVGKKYGLTNFALSFANRLSDVEYIRSLAGDGSFIISKIESRSGLEHLDDIAGASDAVLIDRGDLSRQIPIDIIPKMQKFIIARAHAKDTPVYVATNLLESMVSQPAPTRAEVNDIFNTLLDGADGLVLAAETAIGKFPVKCARMVRKMIDGTGPNFDPLTVKWSDLVSGTRLTGVTATPKSVRAILNGEDESRNKLATVLIDGSTAMDCEHLHKGTYAPVKSFMMKTELESVLYANRMPDGQSWTMPIVLQVDEQEASGFGVGDDVALCLQNGDRQALLSVTEVYRPDLEHVCTQWFGTADTNHPGVARVMSKGKVFVAGDIKGIKSHPGVDGVPTLLPEQARLIFEQKGWSRIVAFHGRNPVHRGHEEIQRRALERVDGDGIFINPVVGLKKSGDFLPRPIFVSYQTTIAHDYLPKSKTVLSGFTTYSRYAGPREAVFTALCRRNMGCTHFIVGRDHTGVGNYYAPDASQRLFDDVPDLGIEPVFFDAIGFDAATQQYGPLSELTDPREISGTQIRDALSNGDPIPEWMMRREVQAALRDEVAAGRPLFVG